MRVALVSLNQAWEQKDQNLISCRGFVQRAKEKGVDLLVFPEMTLTSFSMNTSVTAEDRQTSKTVECFKAIAQEFQLAIVFGVVFNDGDKATNNALLIDCAGTIKASYIKMHPFSFAGEDEMFNGGSAISFGTVCGMTIGLTICYDLRFPELYSALSKHCDCIINIANWPTKRVDHWNVLLKSRAIENQIFIVGVNRTGLDGSEIEYKESSQVINPNGDILGEFLSEDQLHVYDIDSSFINQFKKTFSTTQDRKTEIYKVIL